MKTNAKALFDLYAQTYPEIQASPVYAGLYPGPGGIPTQQVVDGSLYANKLVGQVSSFDDLFKTDDTLAVGLTNVANAQLPANTFFLLTAISLQYGVAAGTTTTNTKETTFGLVPAAIKNGEISISCNKRIVLEKMSCEVFERADHYVAEGDTNASAGTPVTYTMVGKGNVGYYELENPKWLNPQQTIQVALKFASALASANSNVRIVLHGAMNQTL